MRILSTLIVAVALSFNSAPVMAQDTVEVSKEFAGFTVRPLANPDRIKVVEQQGREVLVIERAAAILDGAALSDGVIEFDFAFEDKRGFGGINWHATPDGRDGEYLYFRQHKSGLPDAVQYTPVRSGLTGWQIYSDRNSMAPFAYTYEGWNHAKMVIAGDRADVYLNGSASPQLHIPDLASDRGSGGVAFRSSGPNGKINIAGLIVRPLAAGEGIVGQAAAVRPPPPGMIGQWSVSAPFAESTLEDGASDALARPADATVAVESTGIADLARVAAIGDGADTVVVSTNIRSDEARRVRLNFGYSDRVRLYLNGAPLFEGDAAFRARDFFYLGTVGFKDAVQLPLREGDNVLQAVVSETFGGWAFAGAIEDRGGLTITP